MAQVGMKTGFRSRNRSIEADPGILQVASAAQQIGLMPTENADTAPCINITQGFNGVIVKFQRFDGVT